MQYETIEVEPLSPTIGAEIRGVDLSQPLGNQTFQEVHQALLDHLVIFFRGQHIDLEQRKAFEPMKAFFSGLKAWHESESRS